MILPRHHGVSLGLLSEHARLASLTRLSEHARLASLTRLPEHAWLAPQARLPTNPLLKTRDSGPKTKHALIRGKELPLVIVCFLFINADRFLVASAGNADNKHSSALVAPSEETGIRLGA